MLTSVFPIRRVKPSFVNFYIKYPLSVHCYASCLCFILPLPQIPPPFFFSDVLPLCGPVLPHSEPSSCSPSPALSTDSLSSSSDRSSSQLLASSGDPLPVFTKSVSEPSICSPCDPVSSPGASQSLRPAPTPPNATSAPATPQTGRSCGTGAAPAGAGPPAPGGTPTHSKVSPPSATQYDALNTGEFTSGVSLADLQGEPLQQKSLPLPLQVKQQAPKRPPSRQTPGPRPRLPSHQTQGRNSRDCQLVWASAAFDPALPPRCSRTSTSPPRTSTGR